MHLDDALEPVTPQVADFDGMRIRWDERVLRPRDWTAHQSRWAAELLADLPEGPVLELCSGAGQIGLRAVRDTERRLVCVDANPAAARLVSLNAYAAGFAHRVESRQGWLEDSVAATETFPLVIADPPWVPRGQVGSFPEDPRLAIDGGTDGMEVVRSCLRVVVRHLAPGGAALLQLGDAHQAAQVEELLGSGPVAAGELRSFERGVVLRLDSRTVGADAL